MPFYYLLQHGLICFILLHSTVNFNEFDIRFAVTGLRQRSTVQRRAASMATKSGSGAP